MSSSAVAKADELLSCTFGSEIEEYNGASSVPRTDIQTVLTTDIGKANVNLPEEKYSMFNRTVERHKNTNAAIDQTIELKEAMETSKETPFKAVCSFGDHAYSPSTPFTPNAMTGGVLLSGQGLHTGGSLGKISLRRERDTDIDDDIWNRDAMNTSPGDINYNPRDPTTSAVSTRAGNNEGWLADALRDL